MRVSDIQDGGGAVDGGCVASEGTDPNKTLKVSPDH